MLESEQRQLRDVEEREKKENSAAAAIVAKVARRTKLALVQQQLLQGRIVRRLKQQLD